MLDWKRFASSGRAQERTACPVCDKGPRDKAVSVDCIGMRAKCHRCESTFFPDGEKVERREVIDTSEKDRWIVEKTLSESTAITAGDAVHQYLEGRLGCSLDNLPKVRTHPALRLYNDDGYTLHPAMVVPFTGASGDLVGIHRTWLTPEGRVRRWKGIGSKLSGSAMRLFPATKVLCVAEGIETGIAVHMINSDPVWACGSNTMLENFIPPAGLTHLLIAGDNDANGAGQRSAWKLYRKYKNEIQCAVCIPERIGADWLDHFRGKDDK